MDIPRQRPILTWKDTAWWQATRQAAIAGVIMTAIAAPASAWLASQLMHLSHQPLSLPPLLSELAKGSLAMLPYLWAYFFALERIARNRNKDYPPRLSSLS
ncbi:MAG: hypothetical protein PW789_12090 [Edaphobacter sp.]|uniref:hypothetical protein n=1 Tax=Edaphobacter sp. TaxID=1934404 RepID=UPI00238269A1|nr:hypothetical protein [Edaphobacter sp.]MDE1177325.1 hypothetical protein [Edaphobacter sp.]